MAVMTTRVASAEHVADNVIQLRLVKPEGFTWKTGEFARVGLKIEGDEVFRAYSIGSAPASETVDFYIANVTGGILSPKLNQIKTGDSVLIDTEVGGMLLADRLEAGGKDLWMFASGTGVSPFLAVLSDESITSRFERLILVHGVRTWNETGYVSRLVKRSPKLTVVACVTREKGAAVNERIPDALADGSLEKLAGITIEKEHSRVMLCGNPGMVKSVREAMMARGIVSPRGGKPGQLLAEDFWL